MQHKLELARVIGDLTARCKIIPGDDTRLVEVMDTAMQELLRRPSSVPEQARIGSKGFRGSQEHRWVTVGPEARLEMENWLHHLDADTPSISPLQLKWDQQQLVLSHSGLQWAVEVPDGGAQVQERVIGPALVQPRVALDLVVCRRRERLGKWADVVKVDRCVSLPHHFSSTSASAMMMMPPSSKFE